MVRVGIGYDIHALKKGRPLILGGLHIPHSKGLLGHSDADALYHAITDAIFGALGEGDIGDHFSDKDPKWKNAASVLFAREAVRCAKARGFKISFIDTIVVAEEPKLFAFKKQMRENIARDFKVRVSQVGLKAKTNEGFGPIGKGRAIAAEAAVTLVKG